MDFCLMADGAWIDLTTVWSIARVVIGLGFVIFVHELGHFLVAKMCGVKCEKFYVGFDFFDIKIGDRVIIPRSLLKWRWGETEYGIGVIPLGGYVKMLGQEDNPGQIEAENRRAEMAGAPTRNDGPVERATLDPRSFQSKTVLQRMAIISAGVIFNLIFAVFLAAIAFRSGVNYQPAKISSTVVGGPAWQANLDGADILRINQKRFDQGYAPFVDLAQEVALVEPNSEIEVEFRLPGKTESQTVTLKPEKGLIPGVDLPAIGVNPEMRSQLAPTQWLISGQAAERADQPLQANDWIRAVDGVPVGRLSELKRQLVSRWDSPVNLTVERSAAESATQDTSAVKTLNILVPPNPQRTLGLVLKTGAIKAIRKNSPAETAGFQVGDRLLAIDDAPIGDPLTVDQRNFQKLRQNVEAIQVQVQRGESTSELTVNLRWPMLGTSVQNGLVSIETLGVALEVLPEVGEVLPNSSAAAAGIQPGDSLAAFQIKLPEALVGSPEFRITTDTVPVMGARPSKTAAGWSFNTVAPQSAIDFLGNTLQQLPLETNVMWTLVNEQGESRQANTEVGNSEQYFQFIRGIQLQTLEETYRSTQWTESLNLGYRQVVSDVGNILKFLKRLVTGQLSPKMIGGIGTIGYVATAEANQGTSRLLLFLTILSANLAVINLLPIPVLDGGHLMFLAYEGIFRRPVTERVQIALSWMGMLFILGLMIFAISMDVGRLSGWMR